MNNRYIWFDSFGRPDEVLQTGEKAIAPPRADEVLVRMLASPINPSDLIPITGAYAHRIALPSIPGYEGVGVVEEAGAAVPRAFIGRRVLPLRGEGTWQQWVRCPARWAVIVPPEIEDSAAAQLYINPLTAWVICRERLKLQEGQVLAVNACGSAIGRIFVQMARLSGVRMLAIVRSGAYTAELRRLGANVVIDTSQVPLYEAIMEATNGLGADAAIDSIGGGDGTELARSVRAKGTFITIGLLSGKPLDWRIIGQEKTILAQMFHLRHWNRDVSEQAWQDAFAQLCFYVRTGTLQLLPAAKRFPLAKITQAVRTVSAAEGNAGKIILG
ncbi:zinc-dependent alcohol dehydrogenase family protein [Paenibacillus sp. GCM10027626]|uniref:zinc-dependent alcohol dehydrogenase family protein n=1 Tax=Paenibacillus sp. GCM10027626 TaxID=3273411 RepID=UPI003638302A